MVAVLVVIAVLTMIIIQNVIKLVKLKILYWLWLIIIWREENIGKGHLSSENLYIAFVMYSNENASIIGIIVCH